MVFDLDGIILNTVYPSEGEYIPVFTHAMVFEEDLNLSTYRAMTVGLDINGTGQSFSYYDLQTTGAADTWGNFRWRMNMQYMPVYEQIFLCLEYWDWVTPAAYIAGGHLEQMYTDTFIGSNITGRYWVPYLRIFKADHSQSDSSELGRYHGPAIATTVDDRRAVTKIHSRRGAANETHSFWCEELSKRENYDAAKPKVGRTTFSYGKINTTNSTGPDAYDFVSVNN